MQLALDAIGLDSTTTALWSHSIAAGSVLALACAALAWQMSSDRASAAATAGLAGALVVLHVLTDYLTGRKPTWAHGPIIGLHLYAHPLRDFVLEATVVSTGWLLARRTGSVRAARASAVGVLVILLLLQAAADARLRLGGRLWL